MGFRLKESWGAYFGAGAVLGMLIGQILAVYLPWGKQAPTWIGYILSLGIAAAFFILGCYEVEETGGATEGSSGATMVAETKAREAQ